MKQVFTTINGVRQVVPSYFARVGPEVLGANWQPVNPRTEPVLVFKRHQKTVLESGDFAHLLKVATDFDGAVFADDRRSLEKQDLTIDGIAVEGGDRVEVSATLAIALNILPGTWLAESSTKLVMENPPTFTISNIWSAIGSPWSFRIDPDTQELVGLAPITPANQTYKNGNAAAVVGSQPNFFDGNFDTKANFTNISYQILTVTHDEIEARRYAVIAQSIKVAYETSYKRAGGQLRTNGVNINQLFQHYETGEFAWNSGTFPWAFASTETWVTEVQEPPRKSTIMSLNKDGGARHFMSIVAYGDRPCQLKIGNATPASGTTIVIPDAIAEQMRPRVEGGSYILTENSETAQWRLSKQS
jgi:hypothetical protein